MNRAASIREMLIPDVESLGTGFFVCADHFLRSGFRVFGEIHSYEPVIVIASFEQDCVRVNFLVVIEVPTVIPLS